MFGIVSGELEKTQMLRLMEREASMGASSLNKTPELVGITVLFHFRDFYFEEWQNADSWFSFH